jgi:hypothetical protein
LAASLVLAESRQQLPQLRAGLRILGQIQAGLEIIASLSPQFIANRESSQAQLQCRAAWMLRQPLFGMRELARGIAARDGAI